MLGSGLCFSCPFRSSNRLRSRLRRRLQVPRLSQGPKSGGHVVKVLTNAQVTYMPRHLARTMALLRATSSFVIWTVFSFTFFSSSLEVSKMRSGPMYMKQTWLKPVDVKLNVSKSGGMTCQPQHHLAYQSAHCSHHWAEPRGRRCTSQPLAP